MYKGWGGEINLSTINPIKPYIPAPAKPKGFKDVVNALIKQNEDLKQQIAALSQVKDDANVQQAVAELTKRSTENTDALNKLLNSNPSIKNGAGAETGTSTETTSNVARSALKKRAVQDGNYGNMVTDTQNF